ncbi:MAG TPA: conjugal transfer protein TraF [Pseudomonadales bacterium]|nr:conjugal transfer protein TraF [Pseudomonadales bacterium]
MDIRCVKKLGLLAVGTLPSLVLADPSQFAGPLNTLGNVSTQQTILSATVNPAAGEFVVEKKYRWGYLSTAGLGLEFGEVDDVINGVDDLSAELDRLEEQTIVTYGDALAVQQQFDEFLVELGQKGSGQLNAQLRAPLFPIAIRSEQLKGVVTLDVYATANIGFRFIDSPLEIVPPNLLLGESNFSLATDTAVVLNSAQINTYSVGYSHDLGNSLFKDQESNGFLSEGDRLLVGGKLSVYQATLSSQVVAIDQQNQNEDLGDVISDQYDLNQAESTDVGLDVGVLWLSSNFQLGATLKNINEPGFDASRLGVNCADLTSPSAQNNCEIAADFGAQGRLDLTPEYIMERQLSLEGAISTADRHWNFAVALDANPVAGPVNDEYQWFTASASYFSDSAWIPMARVGFRNNQAGSELSYVSAGLTLFGGTHFDISRALDTVLVDGEELPRALTLSLGFERRF